MLTFLVGFAVGFLVFKFKDKLLELLEKAKTSL